MQLDEAIDKLTKAKEVEAAAKLDVRDYRHRLKRAEQRLEAAMDEAKACRVAVLERIEAQTDSAFDDEIEA